MEIWRLLEKNGKRAAETILQDASLQDLAKKLISLRMGALIVTDHAGHLIGIVSERDLLAVVASSDSAMDQRPVSDVMTRKVITCSSQDKVADILQCMDSNSILHIPVVDGGKLVSMVSIRELTSAYEMLQVEANTDHLTKLSNRKLFLENLSDEYARATRYEHPFSVAMIDIDHFKKVNDTYGHDAGDKAIKALSDLLLREFREVDRVGRLGGEEFAILFPETDLVGATIACERVLTTVRAAKIQLENKCIEITVSIGLAGLTEQTSEGTEILKRADELLYEAKGAGRNCLMVDTCEAQMATTGQMHIV